MLHNVHIGVEIRYGYACGDQATRFLLGQAISML